MSHRGFPITKARRTERRAQAAARQELYNQLTIQEKLDKLPAGHCAKQRAKLEAQIKPSAPIKEATVSSNPQPKKASKSNESA
jgi:hypothetical protein